MRGVAKHFGQRHDGLDAPAARAQVAHDGTGEILRHHHLHRHYWLQEHGTRLSRGLLECHRACDFECNFARIHVVVAAVVQSGLYIHHLVTSQYATFHGFLDALVHRLDEFLGHGPADYFVDELVPLARWLRFQPDLDVSILPSASGLADVLAFRLGCFANGFAVSHLRLAYVGFDRELAHHAVDEDFQVQFTHAADDGLSAVGIGVDFEGGVFLGQLGERESHFFLVTLGLGLDGNRNHRRGEFNRLQQNWVLLVADCVARRDTAQADAGADVARVNLADFLALVGMHLQQTANALAALSPEVVYRVPSLELAGVDANKGELADERVGHDLEREGGEGLVVVRFAPDSLVGIRVRSLHRRDIQR